MKALKNAIFFLFFTLSLNVFGQFDFDKIFINKSPDEKVQLSQTLKNRYIKNDLDSLYLFGLFLMSGETNLNFLGHRYLGSYFLRSGGLDRAIIYLTKAGQHFRVLGNQSEISEISNELGNAYFLLGDYSKSSEHYMQSLRSGLKSDDLTARFNGMFGLGRSFCAKGDTIVGVHLISSFLEESIRFESYESAADASAFLGMIFSDHGDKAVSKLYYNSSIQYAKRCSTRTHLANALTNQAILDCQENRMKSAESNFLKSLEYREKQGARKPTVEAHFNLGNYYMMTSDLKKAEYHLSQSAQIAHESKMITDEFDAIEVLIELFNTSGDQGKVSEYTILLDSLKQNIEGRRDISFEVSDLTSQIIETGDIEVLGETQKPKRIFLLWFGTISLGICCLTVILTNRRRLPTN